MIVPDDCAVIIESVVTEPQIACGLRRVQRLFALGATDRFSIREAAAAF